MSSESSVFRYSAGALLVVVGILAAIVSWTIFPVCEVEGNFLETKAGKLMPMKCGWTARAEIPVGALLVLGGAIVMASKKPEYRRVAGIFSIGLGAVAALLPTYIIGMCAMADHSCRVGTLPALVGLGIVASAIGVVVAVPAIKSTGHVTNSADRTI